MPIATQAITRLKDYRPSDYLIDTVDLDVALAPTATTVRAVLSVRPNSRGRAGAPLALDGDELKLRGLLLDGDPLATNLYEATPASLVIPTPPSRPFRLEILTEVNPTANTKLMGLYRSGGIYCTQCEADGFRRITYMLDRPDVLSVYTTRIEADADEAPILLGNGNPVEAGTLEGTGRHYAVWHDPFPKPCYLFAIVGGSLGRVGRDFATASGRPVEIAVYVEPGKEPRAEYALDALERSMRWDERVWGREYDLDVFNVVAVSDFNMGAMENKGLNIFNDKYVLASPDTATDADYANIEAVIAHEYFHNWTGNRITCRDWFQLCLKEGLTVFRDQEFSSDERSRAVHRIGEVRTLRSRQFAEDAGPLAHPVRPTEYREINNFYTATVYEKGAEIVRMLRTLFGAEDFSRGMTRFFDTCDGTAATVEDFLAAFAAVSGRDLAHFARWYEQAGTPILKVASDYDPGARRLRLRVAQDAPEVGSGAKPQPLVIPIALGLVGGGSAAESQMVRDGLFVLDQAEAEITFEGVEAPPVPSLLRGFSAPVKLDLDLSEDDLLRLLADDTDPFNRWQSAQAVAMRLLVQGVGQPQGQAGAQAFCAALDAFLADQAEADPAFAALVLQLPSEGEIAQEIGTEVDPDAVRRSLVRLRRTLASSLKERLFNLRGAMADHGPYDPGAVAAGRRSLSNTVLDLIAAAYPEEAAELASAQLAAATNMTDRLAGLSTLSRLPGPRREAALTAFADRYADEPLVLDKWFAIQATIPEAETLDRVRTLMLHPSFQFANPNRVRALLGSFGAGNPTQFHRPDGTGYDLLAETVLGLNESNPQVAARLLTAFSSWRTMTPDRQAEARRALHTIAGFAGLSPDVSDILGRTLREPERRLATT